MGKSDMVLFNLSRWIAKEVTGSGDRDMKIYIIGPPAAGKSKTAIALALKLKKWLSWYIHKDFLHGDEFFKMDKDHLAIIDSNDLFRMMTTYPPMYQVRIVDDCGNTEGFDSRQSMSRKNGGLNSIWSTNRTRHCITIVTLHDTAFSDKRQVLLADIVIDLRDYYQSGRFRMARLYKIKMDKHRASGDRGAKMCRFMTYENGQWVTQESLACELPPKEICQEYDKMRAIKDKENTEKVYNSFNEAQKMQEQNCSIPCCPVCFKTDIRYSKKEDIRYCRNCGSIVPKPKYTEVGGSMANIL